MLATALKIKQASDSILSSIPSIKLSRTEVVDGLIELIEAQTEGSEYAKFDVTYIGIGFSLNVTGEIRRKTTFHPSNDYDVPSEYECRAWINVGDYQCYDSYGRKVRSNFSFKWLESLNLNVYS